MTTQQLLDALAAKHQLTTDYQIAKYLGVSGGRISNYRVRGTTFDDLMAVRVADELALDRGVVLTWIHAERAAANEQPEVAQALQRLARRAAAGVLVAVGLSSPPPPASAAPADAPSVDRLRIMLSRRRGLAAWLPFLPPVGPTDDDRFA